MMCMFKSMCLTAACVDSRFMFNVTLSSAYLLTYIKFIDVLYCYRSECGGDYGFFEGDDCSLFSCYTDPTGRVCSGNGTCMSMRDLSKYTYNKFEEIAAVNYEEAWDAE